MHIFDYLTAQISVHLGGVYMEGFHLDFTSRLYMGKASPPTRAGSLSRVTRANYIYFPTKTGIRYKFSFYNLHINKQSLWNETLSKKCWSRQTLSCVRSFDLLALLGGPALLSAFIWKTLALLSYKRKQILTKNLTETRDLGKEGWPSSM